MKISLRINRGGKTNPSIHKVSLICQRHKRYNPSNGGRAAIKGACPQCEHLLEVWYFAHALEMKMRDVEADQQERKCS